MDGVVDPPPLRDLLPGTCESCWRQAGARLALRPLLGVPTCPLQLDDEVGLDGVQPLGAPRLAALRAPAGARPRGLQGLGLGLRVHLAASCALTP